MDDNKNDVTVVAGSAGTSAVQRNSKESDRSVSYDNTTCAERLGSVDDNAALADAVDSSKKGFFAYFRTKEFYMVVILGWVLHGFRTLSRPAS